jgi:hypothetical protein
VLSLSLRFLLKHGETHGSHHLKPRPTAATTWNWDPPPETETHGSHHLKPRPTARLFFFFFSQQPPPETETHGVALFSDLDPRRGQPPPRREARTTLPCRSHGLEVVEPSDLHGGFWLGFLLIFGLGLGFSGWVFCWFLAWAWVFPVGFSGWWWFGSLGLTVFCCSGDSVVAWWCFGVVVVIRWWLGVSGFSVEARRGGGGFLFGCWEIKYCGGFWLLWLIYGGCGGGGVGRITGEIKYCGGFWLLWLIYGGCGGGGVGRIRQLVIFGAKEK